MGVNIPRLALMLGLTCGVVAPGHALVLSATNTAPVIVDGTFDTTSVTLPAGGPISQVTVELDFIKCGVDTDFSAGIPGACSGIAPAFPRDIRFALASPSGSTIELIAFDSLIDDLSLGGPLKLIFSDDVTAVPWGDFGDGYSDAMNPYKAVTSLAFAFNNEQALGDWILTVEDYQLGGAGSLGLSRFTLNVTVPNQSGSIPEPATLALLGLGLAGLGAARRRRR